MNCKNCELEDEYCASGDCPNDTLTAKWESINKSLDNYVVAHVEQATWRLERENAQLEETNEALKSELKEVCDVLIRKCPEMKDWVMMNWKNLYEVQDE